MGDLSKYSEQVQDVACRASQMRDLLYNRLTDGSGNLEGVPARINAVAATEIPNSIYESAGNTAPMIYGTHARAYLEYVDRHKQHPSDELLGSAHQAIENVMGLFSGKIQGGGIFESADLKGELSTTDGIIMRDRMVSLILPVMLTSVTPNMVTLIPGQFNQSEFFRVKRVAGSTFGDLTAGDEINYTYNGRYAVMDQIFAAGNGDGSKTAFSFDSNAVFSKVYPLKKRRVKIFHDHDIVATDTESGAIGGTFMANGTPVVVSGSVNYQTGIVQVTFSVPPAAGVPVHIGYDVNIEKDATLIPIIDHQMDSRTLFPHESAIAGNSTLQALWGMRREFSMDIENLTMQGMRNLLTADKDRKILRDLFFYAKGVTEWAFEGPETLTLKEHYETLNSTLLGIDTLLMRRTGISGLVGIVGGTEVVNIFRYLPAPYFVPASGYRFVAQPHYVGRVFGQWDLYCDPAADAHTALCFARGNEHGQTAYVTGDAVPALTFRHPMLGDLVSKSTMWDLTYRDLQPFDGRNYLTTLRMVPAN